MRGLFVSYGGLTSLIGQSQSFPVMSGLAGRGHDVTVLSYEMDDRAALRDPVAQLCERRGIDWHPKRLRQRPHLLAKLIDMVEMQRTAYALATSKGADLIHCRAAVSGWAGLAVKRKTGLPLVFDMRGFWADERRAAGVWPDDSPLHHRLYLDWKRREQTLAGEADRIVVLTEAARREVETWPTYRGQPIEVIPCSLDPVRFPLKTPVETADARAMLGIAPQAVVVAYCGTIRADYAPEAMLAAFRSVAHARPGARLLMIGHHDPAAFAATAAAHGIDPKHVVSVAAEYDQVGWLLGAADLALCFRLPGYSSIGVSPIKLGEYMAAGLPVVTNEGVGDVADIFAEDGLGLVLPDLGPRSTGWVAGALDRLLASDPRAIRDAALRRFSLDDALDRYETVWQSIEPLHRAA